MINPLEDSIFPPKYLTVIIANIAPWYHFQEPVTHRSVRIELTEEQLNKLKLDYTGTSGYENISQCFLED